MKKLLNLLLLVTFMMGYLEWGNHQHQFIFGAALAALQHGWASPSSFLHPAVFLPLTGIVLLVAGLFQQQPGRWLTLTGIVCTGLLMLLLLVIAVLGLNWKILLSVMPFFVTAFITLRVHFHQRHPAERLKL